MRNAYKIFSCLILLFGVQIQQSIFSSCPTNIGDGRSYDSKFIPSPTQPVIKIRANFIFLQRSDGSGNFQENDPEHQALWDDIIDRLNYAYSSIVNTSDPACYTGSDFVSDARIKFVVNRLFIRDDYGWNNLHYLLDVCPGYSNWYLNYLDNQIVNDPNIPRGINVYFTEDSITYRNFIDLQNTQVYEPFFNGSGCSQSPDATDYLRTSKIHTPNLYSKYWVMKYFLPTTEKYKDTPWDPTMRSWFVGEGRGIAHELGHSMWLKHESPYYGLNECYYSIMHQSGYNPRNYLPPSEVGRIHAALSLTNLRTFIPEDTYIGVKEINITDTWHNMRLYSGLKINNGAFLTFPCDMTMPYQAGIEVLGRLTINNANIRAIKNEWQGIVVKSGGLLELNSTNISDYNITVESGGSIIIKGNLAISGNHQITVKGGGYICIDNSAGIQLSDVNSLIKIRENAIIGINPSLSIQASCISPVNISVSGNGSVIDYNQDVYIQNETITTSRYIGGKNIYVGHHVTNSKPQGDVLITNNANVIFDAQQEVIFDTGFECALGSTFEVVK